MEIKEWWKNLKLWQILGLAGLVIGLIPIVNHVKNYVLRFGWGLSSFINANVKDASILTISLIVLGISIGLLIQNIKSLNSYIKGGTIGFILPFLFVIIYLVIYLIFTPVFFGLNSYTCAVDEKMVKSCGLVEFIATQISPPIKLFYKPILLVSIITLALGTIMGWIGPIVNNKFETKN